VVELQRAGHRVRIVAPASGRDVPAPTGPDGDRLDVVTVPSLSLPMYRSLRIARTGRRGIRRVLRSFAPDVIHLAAPVVFGDRVAKEAKRLGIPTVALFQTDLGGFARSYRGLSVLAEPIWRWVRRVHRRCALTLAPTAIVADELDTRDFGPVAVWGRGVDLEQFNPRRRDTALRARWGLTDDGPGVAVGYVGRLAPEKRVERLAGLGDLPGVQLVIVGDGPARERLTRDLPTAHFTGMLTGDDLGQAVASLDVLVHTGEHETFCQTIQEAMAAGVPAVAPRAGGPAELIDHGATGLLVAPGDDRALTEAVLSLAQDPARRQAMAATAFERVQSRSWSALAKQLTTHYRRVIDRTAADGGAPPTDRMAA
jgi:phosphatidylinositol alpha 1,6-mannosyltransferase